MAQLIAEGASNKMIARSLNISIKTVESHRAAAMRKAGARTAAAFVRFAISRLSNHRPCGIGFDDVPYASADNLMVVRQKYP